MADNRPENTRFGVNQSGLRAYNERLILSLLQVNGAMPGSEIANNTGLSSQTASVILRKLESDGLLTRLDPVRGRVGKPRAPMTLNPDGQFSFGLKIGRRSSELILLDFCGNIRAQMRSRYAYPMPDPVFAFLRDGIDRIQAGLSDLQISRICGIGIAVPGRLWQWHQQLGAPIGDNLAWKGIDFETRISTFSDLPVRIENDASAACRAELLYGHGRAFRDHAYFFLGAFVGGGMVLNNTVFQGHQNNAAAFGSLPDVTDDGQRRTLLDVASLHVLESRLRRSGRNPNELWTRPDDWSSFEPEVSHWQSEAASALARAALATCSVVDFQAIIIDGAVPRPVCTQLAEAVRQEFGQLDHRGVIPPRIEAGQVGQNARAIGAASGPLMSQFMLNSMSGPG